MSKGNGNGKQSSYAAVSATPPASVQDGDNEYLCSDISLWRIDGEAGCESGGGVESMYVLTDSCCSWPPNPHDVISQESREIGWYTVNSIQRISSHSSHGGGYDFTEISTANLLDLDLPKNITNHLVALFLDLQQANHDRDEAIRKMRQAEQILELQSNENAQSWKSDGRFHYKGVRTSYSQAKSPYVKDMIDNLSGQDCCSLLYASLEDDKACFIWHGSVPSEFEVGEVLEIRDRSWTIARSFSVHQIMS